MADQIDFQALADALPVAIVIANADLEIMYANGAALSTLGLQFEQTVGKFISDPQWQLVNKAMEPLALEDYPAYQAATTQQPVLNYEFGVKRPDQTEYTWLVANAYPKVNADGGVDQITISFTDVSFLHAQIPFEQIVKKANDVILITRAAPLRENGPEIVYVNDAFEELTGYEKDEVIGKNPRILQGEETNARTKQRIFEQLVKGAPVKEEIYNYGKDGSGYWLDLNIVPLHGPTGELTHFAAIERDITTQKNKEKELTAKALKDPLTGLFNRRGFEEMVAKKMAQLKLKKSSETSKSSQCLALIDADHFKRINDNYGHDVGDYVLKHLANQLVSFFRGDDLVCRFGGEEFIVFLDGIPLQLATARMDQFRRSVSEIPILLKSGKNITVTVSIGLSEYQTGQTFDATLKKADMALYEAKGAGRNRTHTHAD